MTAACPQCKEPYPLKDARIAGAARLIRCASCSHMFVAKAAGEPEATSLLGADVRAPDEGAIDEVVIQPAKTD